MHASQARDLSDVGVANQVLIKHGADLRFCRESRLWHVYEQGCWKPDDLDALSRVEDTVLELVSQNPNEPQAERLKAQQRLESVLRNLRHKPGIKVSINDFDSDPLLLNATNGAIDLRTGDLHPHER